MSCPEEAICLLYAEDELAGEERRALEAHLVGCLDCRARVMALRDEARELVEVLRGEMPAPRPRPALAAAPPEPGVALGVPLAIAAVTAALAAGGFLLEARLPGDLDLLHPRRLKGAAEMAFDVIFGLRENAPGLVELALSVGSVASVSALLCFAVSSLSRRWFGTTVGLALALGAGLAAGDARALELQRNADLRIAPGERVAESVIATGERVDVDGTIDGDLVAFAERVSVRGEVTGALYVLTRDLEVTGRVGRGVHVIAEHTRLEGAVGGSVWGLTEDFSLPASGAAAGDVHLVSESAVVDGRVGRDLDLVGRRLDLRGSVARDVTTHGTQELRLRDGAAVGGDVAAVMDAGHAPDVAPGARVAGELRAEEHSRPHRAYLRQYTSWRFYAVQGVWYAAALVFGLIVYRLVPELLSGSVVTGGQLFRALGVGFVGVVVAPIAILLAALTIVGIPAAVAGLFVYITALYTADVAVAAWLGRLILRPDDASIWAFGRALAVGLALLMLATLVPFVGPAVGLVVLLLGIGLLVVPAWSAVR